MMSGSFPADSPEKTETEEKENIHDDDACAGSCIQQQRHEHSYEEARNGNCSCRKYYPTEAAAYTHCCESGNHYQA